MLKFLAACHSLLQQRDGVRVRATLEGRVGNLLQARNGRLVHHLVNEFQVRPAATSHAQVGACVGGQEGSQKAKPWVRIFPVCTTIQMCEGESAGQMCLCVYVSACACRCVQAAPICSVQLHAQGSLGYGIVAAPAGQLLCSRQYEHHQQGSLSAHGSMSTTSRAASAMAT